MDFSNWGKERQKLKNEILKELRTQKDQQQLTTISKTYSFNPTILSSSEDHTFGPFIFETAFQGIPKIAFGQTLQYADYVFAVVPYVKEWLFNRGAVEGFNLGMYALLTVPESINRHTVSWIVQGKASHYKGDYITESWTSPYDLADPTHLNIIDKQQED